MVVRHAGFRFYACADKEVDEAGFELGLSGFEVVADQNALRMRDVL